MENIAIEKGVPLPSAGKPGRSIYPFGAMEVGDSFVIPNSAARGGLYGLAARRNMKITIRKDGDSLRVWRTA